MVSSLIRPLLLNNGHMMPRFGLGTFLLTGDEGHNVIHTALRLGYRLIDTAYSYGTEPTVGKAIQTAETEGTVKRSELFVTTKVPPALLAPQYAKQCIEESLDNMKLSYIDLLLIHSPWGLKYNGDGVLKPMGADGLFEYEDYKLIDTWRVFEGAVKAGKVRSIGVSNFTEGQIQRILDKCEIKPQNVQFECHAYYQQSILKKFCDTHGIVCTSFGPLGTPGMPKRHLVPGSKPGPRLLDDPVVRSIAVKHGTTPSPVLLRYLLQNGFVVIPKTSDCDRLKENLSAMALTLDKDDMCQIESLDSDMRYYKFIPYSQHPEFPQSWETF